MADLVRDHEALLLDAYGVLVDGSGALPGARELVLDLHERGASYLLLTNDASRLPSTLEARFSRLGLPIPGERILASGDLLAAFFRTEGLDGARTVVLGPADSVELVRRAGGDVVPASPGEALDVLAVCDEAGFPFLDTLEAATNMLFTALEAGRSPRLVLPNPDLLYPKSGREFGYAAGSIAQMIEAALALRFPESALRFERLGKPHAPIFEEACRRLGTKDAVMVGDQLATDILGARDFGLPSALVGWGLARLEELARSEVQPTYVVERLEPR